MIPRRQRQFQVRTDSQSLLLVDRDHRRKFPERFHRLAIGGFFSEFRDDLDLCVRRLTFLPEHGQMFGILHVLDVYISPSNLLRHLVEHPRDVHGLDDNSPFTHFPRDRLPAVSYTHLRAHETRHDLVCRLLLEKKKNNKTKQNIKKTKNKQQQKKKQTNKKQ